MKKLTVLLLLIAMILTFTACGGEEPSKDTSEPQITDDIPAPTESDIVSDEGVIIEKTIKAGKDETYTIKYDTKTHKLELSNAYDEDQKFPPVHDDDSENSAFVIDTYYVDATQSKNGNNIVISGELKQFGKKLDMSDVETFLDAIREEHGEETCQYYESLVDGLLLSGEEYASETYKRDLIIEVSFAGDDSVDYFKLIYKALDTEITFEEKYKVNSDALSEIEYYNDGEISQRIICNADGSSHKYIRYIDGKVEEEYLIDEDGYFIEE